MKYAFIKNTLLARSQSQDQFFHELRKVGLKIEYKQSVPVGIRDSQRFSRVYKWRELGITPNDFVELKQRSEMAIMKKQISELQQFQQRQLNKDQNLKQDR